MFGNSSFFKNSLVKFLKFSNSTKAIFNQYFLQIYSRMLSFIDIDIIITLVKSVVFIALVANYVANSSLVSNFCSSYY